MLLLYCENTVISYTHFQDAANAAEKLAPPLETKWKKAAQHSRILQAFLYKKMRFRKESCRKMYRRSQARETAHFPADAKRL